MGYKIVETDAWSFQEPSLVEIPKTRTGFGVNDMHKMASRLDPELVQKLAGLQWKEGEVPIHLIAIGATEAYGPNRNGDGFPEAACRMCHPTFVKFAKFYRNHQADDPEKSYGVVKLSHYNEKMRRIELVCGLNGTPKVARENHGLVADRELKKLAADEDIPVSMGTYVPYDTCSACGHRAPTSKEYCDTECPGGGLRTKIATLLEDGSVLHAINDICRFCDISHVRKQADRIAYVTGMLRKTASTRGSETITGADLADLFYDNMAAPHPIALKLAAVDTSACDGFALGFVGRNNITIPPGLQAETMKLATAALADANIVLPADQFTRLLGATDPHFIEAVKIAAATVFHTLSVPSDNPYVHRGQVPLSWCKWAADLIPDYGMDEPVIRTRVSRNALREVVATRMPLKSASLHDPLVGECAEQYGLYVVASLERIQRQGLESPLTPLGIGIQNQTR